MRGIINLFLISTFISIFFGNYSFAETNQKSLLRYTRLGVDQSGESFFQDENVELSTWPFGMAMASFEEQSDSVRFFKAKPGWQMLGLHYAPKRQYLLVLKGVLEIHTSTGKIRQFQQGSFLLVEDTYGKGHRTRNAGEDDLILVWVGIEK
jgi:hypothetical protein